MDLVFAVEYGGGAQQSYLVTKSGRIHGVPTSSGQLLDNTERGIAEAQQAGVRVELWKGVRQRVVSLNPAATSWNVSAKSSYSKAPDEQVTT